jgi:hypothetical protein
MKLKGGYKEIFFMNDDIEEYRRKMEESKEKPFISN